MWSSGADLRAREHAHADVTVVIAPAGFGKTTWAEREASSFSRAARCDLDAPDPRDLVQRIAAALATEDASRRAEIAEVQASLALSDGIERREHLLHLWSRNSESPSCFVLDNLEALDANAEAQSLLADLLARRPAHRRLIICSRSPIDRVIRRHLFPDRTRYVSTEALMLTHERSVGLLIESGAEPEQAEVAARLSGGWAIAVLLFCRFARMGSLARALDAPTSDTYESIFRYLSSEYMNAIPVDERGLLIAACACPAPSSDDLAAACRLEADRCAELIAQNPFVRHVGADRFEVHPLLRAYVSARYRRELRRSLELIRHAAESRGDLLRAAELSVVDGDQRGAIAALLALPASMSAHDLARLLDLLATIDVEALLEEPNIWISTLEARRFTMPLDRLVAEGRRMYALLPTIEDAFTRFEIARQHVSILINAGDARAALEIVQQLRAHNVEAGLSRPMEIIETAILSIFGKYELARSTFRRLGIADHTPLVAKYLDLVEATAALRSGSYDDGIAYLESALALSRKNGLAAPLLITLSNLAFEAWLVGDDQRFERVVTELKTSLPPGLSRAWQFWISAAAGDADAEPTGYEPRTIRSIGYLFMSHAASGERRRQHAKRGFEEAVASSDVGLQILAAINLLESGDDDAASTRATIHELARAVDLQPFRDAVEAYLNGSDRAGVLDKYVVRRVRNELRHREATKLSIVAAHVTRAGTTVALTVTELAVMTYLAIQGRAVPRETIADALWPEADADAAHSNLRVVVHRVRRKLGEQAIVLIPSGYCLGAIVDVDLFDYEKAVRRLTTFPLSASAVEVLERIVELASDDRRFRLLRFDWFVSVDHRVRELVRQARLLLARNAMKNADTTSAIDLVRPLLVADGEDEMALEVIVSAERATASR